MQPVLARRLPQRWTVPPAVFAVASLGALLAWGLPAVAVALLVALAWSLATAEWAARRKGARALTLVAPLLVFWPLMHRIMIGSPRYAGAGGAFAAALMLAIVALLARHPAVADARAGWPSRAAWRLASLPVAWVIVAAIYLHLQAVFVHVDPSVRSGWGTGYAGALFAAAGFVLLTGYWWLVAVATARVARERPGDPAR